MLAILITIATCATAWLLTSPQPNRTVGSLFGLIDSILWLFAGIAAGKTAVMLIAAFCALCFLRPLLRSRSVSLFGSKHAN
ncbi:hypothetical protein [Paraburkholderia tropica]|uniref:hypothetical protein n=1 Tax=Paraburkholderia tropica TaxID=92647 RepID=UPI002AB706DE|nr:hypothetical protein [Paraburkholderia tropica]